MVYRRGGGISATTQQSLAVKPKSTRLPKGTLTAVPCLDCKQPVGEHCKSATGKFLPKPHQVRKHQTMQLYLSTI